MLPKPTLSTHTSTRPSTPAADFVRPDADRFLRLRSSFRTLARTLGEERVRQFWEIAEIVFTTVAADARAEIEAARGPLAYEAVLRYVGGACVDALRIDPQLTDLLPTDREMEAALEYFRFQLPAFLETRLGQSYSTVTEASTAAAPTPA